MWYEAECFQELWGLILTIIDGPDLCSSVLLIGVLCFIGQFPLKLRPQLGPWCGRVAFTSFLVYVVAAIANTHPGGSDELLSILLRGAVATGVTYGVAMIALPTVAVIWSGTIGFMLGLVARCVSRFGQRYADLRRSYRDAARRMREQELAAEQAPLREEEARKRAEASRVETARLAGDQRRREAIRLECELLYDRHAAPLHDTFPRQRFEAHLTQTLTDNLSPELVEQRAEKLRHLIQELAEQAAPRRQKFTDIQAISSHFEARRQELDTLPYDDEAKASLRAIINMQESTSIQELLKSP